MALFKTDHSDLVQSSKNFDAIKRNPNIAQRKFQSHGWEVKSPPGTYFAKRMKFHGEPNKPPMNEYEKFHWDL